MHYASHHLERPDGPTPARKRVGVGNARRQLRAALDALERQDFSRAQLMVGNAVLSVEGLIEKAALVDADVFRNNAIRTARKLKDARGRRRSPATMPGYNKGRPNVTKGKRYKPTPPSVNDTLKMLAAAPSVQRVSAKKECAACGAKPRHKDKLTKEWVDAERHSADCCNPYGERLRATILLLWRGGFRVGCELLRLTVDDLHPDDGYIYVADGKNGKSREVVVDPWVWPMLEPWLAFRSQLPGDSLFCVIEPPTAGRAWSVSNLRRQLHELADHCEIKTRVAPHQFRHSMAVQCVIEGIPELYVSRQLGHADLGITSTYLQGLPQSKVREALSARPMPQISMMEALKNEGVRFKRNGTPDLMSTFKTGVAA